MIPIHKRWAWLDPIEKIWMVGNLLELHENIEHLDAVSRLPFRVYNFYVTLEDLLV
jgi:hypothetical protein